jgi:hypothetical protein
LAALAFVAARSTTAPVWHTCPPPRFVAGMPIVHACVDLARECPRALARPGVPALVYIQCWVWFPGDHNEAPGWRLRQP